jgi:hypothetical protein
MWLLEYLLLNSALIKEKADIDSDEFNYLLIVETEIKKFKEQNIFSEEELSFLDMLFSDRVVDQKRFTELSYKVLDKISLKLSISLGGIFTDVGYLEYMKDKYKLTDEQLHVAEKFMLSRFRNRILHTPYRDKK